MIYLGIIFTILVSILLLLNIKKEDKEFKKNKVIKYLYMFFSILYIFILLYKLGMVPKGIHIDEAGMMYDAYNISKYGVDRYLYHNPVYLINFGGGQNALYTYLASLLFRVLPINNFVMRLPAVILSLISSVFLVGLIKKQKGEVPGLISLIMLCILPFSIMHSRWGLESYLFFPMLIISFYFYLKATDTKKNRYFLLAGILFGITLYTYAISYLVLPLFLGITIIYALIHKKIKISNVLCLSIPLFILALPLMLMILINKGIIPEIKTNYFSIPKMLFYRGGEFSLKNILDNWDIFGIILWNDGWIYNSNKAFGTMYYMSIPFIIYGLVISIKNVLYNKEIDIDFLINILFLSCFIVGLILSEPNVNKLNAIYFPLIYYLVLGIYKFLLKNHKLSIILVLGYGSLYIGFLKYYFIEYPNNIQNDWLYVNEDDITKAAEYALTKDSDTIYFNDNEIYIALALKVSAYAYQDRLENANWNKFIFDIKRTTDNTVYIFMHDKDIPDNLKDHNREDFNGIKVVYQDN